MLKTKPYVGQKVRLTDEGIEIMPRLSRSEMQAALNPLIVTAVWESIPVDGEEVWPIEVEGR